MTLTEALTPGAARALSKLGTREPCSACGFSLPKYPGRYPSNCPQCDTPMNAALAKPDEPDEEPEDDAA